MDFGTFTQLLLPGITTGCVYALVALGFVLCASVCGVVNMAQGEYVMLGGVMAAFLAAAGLPTPLAILVAVLAGAALGILQERLTLAPVRRSPAFIQITVTLGVAVVIRGLVLIIFGKDPMSMAGFSGDGAFTLLGAVMPIQTLWVWATTAVLLGATYYFLMHTDMGRAVRACAIDREAAQMMGVSAQRLTLFVLGLSGAMGALAGAVITPIVLAGWDAGVAYGLKGFIGAILGGFRSPVLAVVGGLGIGVIESMSAGYISSGWKDAIVYGLLLAYLLARGGVFVRGRGVTLSGNAHS